MTLRRTFSAALFSALLLHSPFSPAQAEPELPDDVELREERGLDSDPAVTTEPAEAAPPVEAQPEKAPEVAPEVSADSKTRGLLGPVLIGPVLSTFALPTFARVGLETKITRWAGLSVESGVLPRIPLSGVTVEATANLITARLYPFQGSFFLGVGFGSQTLKAQKTEKIQGVEVTGSMDVTTPFYTPQLGWRWIWPSGFMMGMEFGYQISQGASVTVASNAPPSVTADPQYVKLENDIKDAGDKIGNVSLPHVALLQIGYFF